jgi:hypothetical protein
MSSGLEALIKRHYWTRGHKVLLCAQDVADGLGVPPVLTAQGPPRRPWEADLDAFMAVTVIVTPDSPPGSWRLVRHDQCTVNLATDEDGQVVPEKTYVSHERCAILGENLGSNDPE